MPTLQVITLGCSKNTVDTEHLLFQVRHAYELVPESESRPVDVLLVNTCGFIGDAKEQSIQIILACVARKKAGEVGRLIVFGCLS
jgi:ribosomal protein S12 methylthiotransferase